MKVAPDDHRHLEAIVADRGAPQNGSNACMVSDPISWQRLRAMFGYPKPVAKVTERQFDYNDEQLQKLGRTPLEEIDFQDLWYYYHDLAYVELQPELFAYLFPVCLMDWHRSLLANKSCRRGDSEFHYGVHRGQIFQRMLTDEQRRDVFAVFRDSFHYRLDRQRELPLENDLAWLSRFNSLAKVLPDVSPIWHPWWNMETRGRAVATMIYCSAFVYEWGEVNPFWDQRSEDWLATFGPLTLWPDDSNLDDKGWLIQNVEFVRSVLTTDYVFAAVDTALERLAGKPEHSVVLRLQSDMPARRDVIQSRVSELPDLLAKRNARWWTV